MIVIDTTEQDTRYYLEVFKDGHGKRRYAAAFVIGKNSNGLQTGKQIIMFIKKNSIVN